MHFQNCNKIKIKTTNILSKYKFYTWNHIKLKDNIIHKNYIFYMKINQWLICLNKFKIENIFLVIFVNSNVNEYTISSIIYELTVNTLGYRMYFDFFNFQLVLTLLVVITDLFTLQAVKLNNDIHKFCVKTLA